MKMIEFQNVSKSFKNKYRVLSELNFSCMAGQTYFLFGNTGTGKSTVFNLIIKDIAPNMGKIEICGDDISQFKPQQTTSYRLQLGIIWQSLFLIDQKTIFENIAMPLELRGESTEIVDEILKDANLFSFRDLFPYNLTLAQKQMTAICRALVTIPKILIADEPMNHLDTGCEGKAIELINKYKHPSATVLMATSQQYIIEKFQGNENTNVLILENGKILGA